MSPDISQHGEFQSLSIRISGRHTSRVFCSKPSRLSKMILAGFFEAFIFVWRIWDLIKRPTAPRISFWLSFDFGGLLSPKGKTLLIFRVGPFSTSEGCSRHYLDLTFTLPELIGPQDSETPHRNSVSRLRAPAMDRDGGTQAGGLP